jgi:hypothetical protein
MKSLTTAVVLLLSMSSVAAPPVGSSWKDAKVTDVTVYTAGGAAGKGYVLATLAANGTGTPNCASGYPRNVAIDITTEAGRVAYASMSQSMMFGQAITVTGTGACSVIPNTETLASLQIQPMH